MKVKNMKLEIDFSLSDLKNNWKPKIKKESGFGYHGSTKGDKIEFEMYFDEYHSEWTSFKDKAFKGFVLKK